MSDIGKEGNNSTNHIYLEHKDTKKRRFYLDKKTTSDLKVATKSCGRENFVDFVQSSFAALCIFHQLKMPCFFVSLCLKLYQLDSY